MTAKTPTPRTDRNVIRGFEALRITLDEEEWVRADFARALETELAASQAQLLGAQHRLAEYQDDEVKSEARVAELTRKLAEAQENEARYLWLKREQPAPKLGYADRDCVITIEFKWPKGVVEQPSLDDAIDVARGKSCSAT